MTFSPASGSGVSRGCSGVSGVTVVVALYRNRNTIGQALSSVLEQTRPPDAVIVVDDGSDDGSADFVRENFPGVHVLSQENAGPASARNTGWRAASTEWIAFMDADDVWEPQKLEEQLQVAARFPEAGLIASNWRAPGAGRGSPGGPAGMRGVSTTSIGRRLSASDILLLNRFQTSTVLVRRSVLEETGGFDRDLDGTEDWDLWLRCSRRCGVIKVEAPLVRYRDSTGSYSKNGARVRASMRSMLSRELPISGLSPRRQSEVRAWHELRFVVSFLLQRRPELVRDGVQELGRRRLWSAVPAALVRYLLPFLVRRRLRRLRPIQPLRLEKSSLVHLRPPTGA